MRELYYYFFLKLCIFYITNLKSPKVLENDADFRMALEQAQTLSNEKKNASEAILSTIANEFLIVTVANFAHYDLVLNWYASVSQTKKPLNNYIIFSLDLRLHEKLLKRNLSSVYVFHLLNKNDAPIMIEKEQKWGSNKYAKLTLVKTEIVHALLKKYNVSVLFTDIDVVWLHDSIENYIKLQMKSYEFDILYSQEFGGKGILACTGFYAIKPNKFTIKHLQNIIATAKKTNYTEQVATNIVLRQYADRTDIKKIGYLDILLFPNGYIFQRGISDIFKVKNWIFHANFVIGHEGKVKFMKDLNYWYINETEAFN